MLLLALSTALAADPSQCGNLHPDIENPVMLLDGRLQMRVPSTVELVPNPATSTGAPASASEQTWAMLDKGGVDLMLFAEEHYHFATPDEVLGPWLDQPAFVGIPAGVHPTGAVQADPRLHVYARELGGAVLGADHYLLAAAIQMPEGTWVNLQLRVHATHADQAATCAAILYDALSTLAPGLSTLDPKPHHWGLQLGHRAMALQLGPEMVARFQRASDHLVVRVSRLTRADGDDGELLVYLGDQPRAVDTRRAVFSREKWMGERGAWYAGDLCADGSGPCTIDRLQAVPADGSEGWPKYAYALVAGDSPGSRDLMVAVANSIRWFNPVSEPDQNVRMTLLPGWP
jgi:hypothetical protein